MVLRLNSAGIHEYLMHQGLCDSTDVVEDVQQLMGKNLNLLVRLTKRDGQASRASHLLLKQGPIGRSELPKQDFEEEWRIQRLLASHEQLFPLQALLPEGIKFDTANAIQIFRYLEAYGDLGDFYSDAQRFPIRIPVALGSALATLHQATFRRKDYHLELDPEDAEIADEEAEKPDFRDELENLTPEIFRRVSIDGLKFYKLYNRIDELSKAVAQLEHDYEPCCLIHHDLKFRNILLHHDWRRWQPPSSLPASGQALCLPGAQGIVRLIDWEQWTWGDPALDVGALVAEYLRLWLKGLVLSRDVDLAVALQLAAVPLVTLQPSLAAFLQAYLSQFPGILTAFPAFPARVLRFAGLGLIGAIQDRLHYRESFGNLEISMLQVARSLLCNPEAAMVTVFGRKDFQPDDFPADGLEPDVGDTGDAGPAQSTQDKCELQVQVPLPHWVQYGSGDEALTDLINSVRIEPPLITHPAYQHLDLVDPGEPASIGMDQRHQRLSKLPDDLRQAYLLRQVRNYLYDIYFSGEQERKGPRSAAKREIKNDAVSGLNVDYFHRIQLANWSTGFLDPDWKIIRWNSHRAQVEKDGLRLWVDPAVDLVMDEVLKASRVRPEGAPSVTDGSAMAVGTAVVLRLPNAVLNEESYRAIGNSGEPAGDQSCITIYFNLSAEGALILMHVLSRTLNHQACPFALTILTDPATYGRYNSASLAVEASRFSDVRTILCEHYDKLQPHLSNPIPLFTWPLAPGIGLVESPPGQDDFGLARCQILAEALLTSGTSPQSRRRAMQEKFAERNLDWQRPHLNPESNSHYPPLPMAVPSQAQNLHP
jgi:hypothetical protein